MINTDINKNSLKAIRTKEKADKEIADRAKCEALAIERYGENEVAKMSNANKGLWYLSVIDASDEGEVIEKMAIMKPVTRAILSYATSKMEDGGLYDYLGACMEQCFICGDNEILEDDTYFIPAANTFNKMLEGKKANLLKR